MDQETPEKTTVNSSFSAEKRSEGWSLETLTMVLGAKGKAVWNAMTSLGPRALSLWPEGSKNLLRHQMGKEAIAGWKESLELENKSFASVEGRLLDQIPTASTEDLLEIERKLEFLRGKRNQMDVVGRALGYITEKSDDMLGVFPPSEASRNIRAVASEDRKKPESESVPISGHWMDHFNRLARQRNEAWRSELLARALAVESENVGTVSPRALFVIGTLEETAFQLFVFWLNHCIRLSDRLFMPWGDWMDTLVEIPDLPRSWSLHSLRTKLEEMGLTSGHGTMEADPNSIFYRMAYADKVAKIKVSNETLVLHGSFSTSIGTTLAKYHSFEPTEFGHEIFSQFLRSIEGENVEVSELS